MRLEILVSTVHESRPPTPVKYHMTVFYCVLDVVGTAPYSFNKRTVFLISLTQNSLSSPGQSWAFWVNNTCWWNRSLARDSHLHCPMLHMADFVYFFTGFHRKNIRQGFHTLTNSSKSPFPGHALFLQLRMVRKYKSLAILRDPTVENGQEVCLLNCLVFYLLWSNWRKLCVHKGLQILLSFLSLKKLSSFCLLGKPS